MRRTFGRRAMVVAGIIALGVGLAACGGESTAQRTVTVTGTTPVTAPPPTTPTTTAPVVTAPPATAPTPTVATPVEPPATAPDPVIPAPADPADEVLVARPANFPLGGERFLLARLAPDVARRCTRERQSSRSRGSIAGLACDTQSVYGARSFYELFRNRVEMENSYSRYREANGVPIASGQCVPAGGGGRVPGDATWGFGPEAPSEGRVMCFRTRGQVWFITSIEDINVLAFAQAGRFGQVDRFWRSVGLPTEDPVG